MEKIQQYQIDESRSKVGQIEVLIQENSSLKHSLHLKTQEVSILQGMIDAEIEK